MPFVIIMVFSFLFLSCSSNVFKAETVSEEETNEIYTFTYTQPASVLLNKLNESIADLHWVKMSEESVTQIVENGKLNWSIRTLHPNTSDDRSAWLFVSPKHKVDKLIFVKARTPMSPFSYGAELYISVFSLGNESTIRFSASTMQIVEKKHLPKYMMKLSDLVNEKMNALTR